jgi:hypothetical protein
MSISTFLTQLFSAVQDFQVINMDFNITHVSTQAAFFKYVGEKSGNTMAQSVNCLLLILQSFDWLAAFHPELLQAILFIAA